MAKGAALYAAGQTVRYVEKDEGHGGQAGVDNSGFADSGMPSLAVPGPVTEQAFNAARVTAQVAMHTLNPLYGPVTQQLHLEPVAT